MGGARVRAGLATVLAFGFLALLGRPAWAAGTPAGTQIPNTAVLTYISEGVAQTRSASSTPVVVAKLLSVRATWQDSTAVPVRSPDTLGPLTFLVTNTGNGQDRVVLGRQNTVAGDQFDPADAPEGSIWIESGSQPGFQATGPNADLPYVAGSNDITLAPDASRIVYVVSSIPAGFGTGATARADLQARSRSVPPGTPLGTQVDVQAGVPFVAGPGSAGSTATGTYLVSVVAVGVTKTVASVVDPGGGTRVMPGAVLTYRLVVNATGTGTASNVVVADPLPATLAFVPGSITVDGAARTDAADGDDSSFSSGTVRTVLPSLTAPQSRAIEFKATVN